MASKLGEAFVEITGRDIGLKKAWQDAKAKTREISRLEAKVRLNADDTALQKKLAKAKAELAELRGPTTGTGAFMSQMKMVGGAVAAIAATLQLNQVVSDSVNEAMAAEDAQIALASALQRLGDTSPATVTKLQEIAAAIQDVTRFEDDAIISGMAMLANFGVGTNEMGAAARAAVAYAEVMKVDLPTAFAVIAKAHNGRTRDLQAMIPALKNAKSSEEKFALTLKWGASAFGVAEAAGKTTKGTMDQLNVALGNLKETFGTFLLPAIKPVAEFMKSIVNAIDWAAKSFDKLEAKFGAIGTAIKTAIRSVAGLFPPLQALFALIDSLSDRNKKAAESAEKLNKASKESAVITATTTASAATDKKAAEEQVADSQKKAAEEGQRIIEDAKRDRDAFAEKVMARVRALRQQREEQEKAKASDIGWSALGDVWKNAATSGLKQQFAQSTAYKGSPFSEFGTGTNGAGSEFSTKSIWDAARAEQSAERRHRELLNKIGALAQGGSL